MGRTVSLLISAGALALAGCSKGPDPVTGPEVAPEAAPSPPVQADAAPAPEAPES